MSTTRGGETVSAQIGTIGPIEGLSTGNFKMEDTPFNIKNDGETAVVLEVNLWGMEPVSYTHLRAQQVRSYALRNRLEPRNSPRD